MADSLDYLCAWVMGEKDSFENLIDLGEKSGKEQGFNICQTLDGNLVFGTRCEGGECSVALHKSCGDSIDIVGTYHTHPSLQDDPKLYSNFSGQDLLLSLVQDRRIICLGYELEKQRHVNCLKIKDTKIPEKDSQVFEILKDISYSNTAIKSIRERGNNLEIAWAKIKNLPDDQLKRNADILYTISESLKRVDETYQKELKLNISFRDKLLELLYKKGYIEACNG
jgi:hypothetical protein